MPSIRHQAAAVLYTSSFGLRGFHGLQSLPARITKGIPARCTLVESYSSKEGFKLCSVFLAGFQIQCLLFYGPEYRMRTRLVLLTPGCILVSPSLEVFLSNALQIISKLKKSKFGQSYLNCQSALFAKGQLISKAIYSVLDYPKKRTKKI